MIDGIKVLIILLFCSASLMAQPSYIFQGGDGSGWSASEGVQPSATVFKGGEGQGFSYENSESSSSILYNGGVADGSSYGIDTGNHFIYNGGNDDGSSLSSNTAIPYIYNGGDDDGYTGVLFRTPFIWTGAIGTAWNVGGNWNYNLIPGIYRPVIIPDGVPNWPFVNAGIFNIGDNPNNGVFKCASLWIQEGALLFTRINNRVENYGLITIDGTMTVKKTTPDAFQNFVGSQVIISNGGSLIIKP